MSQGLQEDWMMKKEKGKGLGMSPKRALLSHFSFTLSHYIKHIEKTIKTHELVITVR